MFQEPKCRFLVQFQIPVVHGSEELGGKVTGLEVRPPGLNPLKSPGLNPLLPHPLLQLGDLDAG